MIYRDHIVEISDLSCDNSERDHRVILRELIALGLYDENTTGFYSYNIGDQGVMFTEDIYIGEESAMKRVCVLFGEVEY
jgi:hypothetical protein